MDVKLIYPDGMTRTVPDLVRIEIPVEGCIGTEDDKVIVLDADDSLDLIVESAGNREAIHSWLKVVEL